MAKVLVLGGGYLGGEIQTGLSKQHKRRQKKHRLIELEVRDIKGYDVIINATGKTDLAWCEDNGDLARAANVTEVIRLLDLVKKADSRLIHLSSGCIWKGPWRVDGEPFEPDDPPSPTCVYTQTKVEAEKQLWQNATDPGMLSVLRIRMPYGYNDHPRNLISKIQKYEKLIDDPNSMTSVKSLLLTINSLLTTKLLWGRATSVYDYGVMSPYRIGIMLTKAGVRNPPILIEKSDMDGWHKPQRVSTVMCDVAYENTIDAPNVDVEVPTAILQLRRFYCAKKGPPDDRS